MAGWHVRFDILCIIYLWELCKWDLACCWIALFWVPYTPQPLLTAIHWEGLIAKNFIEDKAFAIHISFGVNDMHTKTSGEASFLCMPVPWTVKAFLSWRSGGLGNWRHFLLKQNLAIFSFSAVPPTAWFSFSPPGVSLVTPAAVLGKQFPRESEDNRWRATLGQGQLEMDLLEEWPLTDRHWPHTEELLRVV